MLAEEGGFEPPVPLQVRQFSKLLVSATHPSFLINAIISLILKFNREFDGGLQMRRKDRKSFILFKFSAGIYCKKLV